ncbi:MAG: hypothetical protein Q4B03_08305 [Lachnospiraceae bacterium]|nr:hypothetical protein [Lachnospiraceae bacterium]
MIGTVLRYFDGGDWIVLYRERETKDFHQLQGQKNYWYADPFLLEYNGKTFLLTEAFDNRTQIGKIAVSEELDGTFEKPVILIENMYHMSYPCVFEYKGKVYILPETGESKRLELYEFDDFPKPHYTKYVLLEGVRYDDCTVLSLDTGIHIWAYDDRHNRSLLYSLDLSTKQVKLLYARDYKEKKHRPAGALYEENGKLFRPSQNCTESYGGSLLLNEIVDIACLKDRMIHEYKPEDVSECYTKLHTYNRSSRFETIDVFLPQKGIGCFIDNIKRKIHRMKMEKNCDEAYSYCNYNRCC